MCQSVWYNPTTWGCGVSNAWNSLTSAFQKRVAGPFVKALMHLFFSLIHIVVYAILDGLTTLIKTELSLITDASKSLGILSLPVFAGLFVDVLRCSYMCTWRTHCGNVPAYGVCEACFQIDIT